MVMPAYTYRCPNCGHTHTITCHRDSPTKAGYDEGHAPCTECAVGNYRRSYASERVSIAPILHSHYNHTTGTVVGGWRDFREQLKIKSAEAEARTGIPTNLQPADPSDLRREALEKFGDAGLKEQHDAAVARGEKEPAAKKVL